MKLAQLLVLVSLQLSAVLVSGCREGWFDGTAEQLGCLEFFTSADGGMAWSEAADYCNSQGGHLVEIFNEEQQNLISVFASAVEEVNGAQSYWIGASDANRDGSWYWTFSLLPAEYTAWANQPTEGEDYAALAASENYLWMAHTMDQPLFPLCQRDPDPPHCVGSTADISPVTHEYAQDGLTATRIAFSSCYLPGDVDRERGDIFWQSVRSFQPDIWLWLGDNMYADGTDMTAKRLAYNEARDHVSYVDYGPVMQGGVIPVMGIWDDHDYGYNDAGNEYTCPMESQTEFSIHFNLPESDPRHPNYGGGERQAGVYNARMFQKPDGDNGIHVVMVDNRSGRDPTFPDQGVCRGADTQMLTDAQWSWLEAELLEKRSEVKLIATGIQVLPPTEQRQIEQEDYCADDSHSPDPHGTTFHDAIHSVGEDLYWQGTVYESWANIPQERARLLQLAQRAINNGTAQVVVFATGDRHYAELMAKRMPETEAGGPAQTLYEITASGIFRNWIEELNNSNRLRDRSCDDRGSGPFVRECALPFKFGGKTYYDCTYDGDGEYEWCAWQTDEQDNLVEGKWGYCDIRRDELVQVAFSNSTHTCGDGVKASKYFICSATGTYGGLEVDFEARKLRMTVWSPIENEQMYHEIVY